MRILPNARYGTPGLTVLPGSGFRRARAAISGWADYGPTPLHDLPALADTAGLGLVRLKDEATRFGLGSFKALGGAYAVAEIVENAQARSGQPVTVTAATDGNHGRAVAWGASRHGCKCVIFVHEGVSAGRVLAIEAFGAEVRRVGGTYDDAVRTAAEAAASHGWHLVSDTAFSGYLEVPRAIMQGYRVMADEALDQWDGPPPTHAFVQAGVGGGAAAVSVHLRSRLHPAPRLIVVEPEHAACLLASAEAGEAIRVGGALDTLMAGLACGEPSLLAWQELERAAFAFMAIPDEAAVSAMRRLAELEIVSGESGAAGLAGLLLAAADPDARAMLGLGPDSRVLLFSTEGATDLNLYRRLVGATP
jgi:diaminopropionate ammonia-lyase